MDLVERVNAIGTRDDFVTFVHALRDDLKDNPETWENPTLDRFLEALTGWVQDMDGYFANQGRVVPEEPDWRLVGDMLYAAKVYE